MTRRCSQGGAAAVRAAERAHVDRLRLLHLLGVGPVAEGEEGGDIEHQAKERKGEDNARVDAGPRAGGAAAVQLRRGGAAGAERRILPQRRRRVEGGDGSLAGAADKQAVRGDEGVGTCSRPDA